MQQKKELRFDGKVVVVTGAGGGLGREYALLFASRGASVVVNDLGGTRSGEGKSEKAADVVVDEIRAKGGKAISDYNSVENGEKIIETAIQKFGRIDVLINNAGILRDKSFLKISEEDWDTVQKVHLRGSFLVTKAAWPYFKKQNYGRIIMTCSAAGLYGNFGQSNYSSAKLGLLGLSNTLAIEGEKYNIHCNTVVPVAASRLTEDILPPPLFQQLKPTYVAPLAVWLCHEECADNGGIFEAAGGWVGKYRWERSGGKAFIPPDNLNPESIRDHWSEITSMAVSTHPKNIHDQMSQLVNSLSGTPNISDGQSQAVDKPGFHSYKEEDVILYALGVGATTKYPVNLKFLYENHENFSVLPTYAVIPSLTSLFQFGTISEAAKSLNLRFDPTKLLHGEQYLELKRPLPPNGCIRSEARVVDVLDKGSGAVVITEVNSYDQNGRPLFYNQFALFLVGAGKFGGPRESNKPEIKTIVETPKRQPDACIYEETSKDQAALYRLSGDKNPLHIDPAFAAVGGFDKPILHGLCSLGFATRHILNEYANNDVSRFKAIKARFSGTILPGETIQTNMWKEGNRILFECIVRETGKPVISGGYLDLHASLEPQSSNPNTSNLVASPEGEDFLSDPIFEEMGRRATMVPNLSSEVNAIFEFQIKSANNKQKTWTLDLKNSNGGLYLGKSKAGPASCVIQASDQDMSALMMGLLDPVKAFMNGQIKIQGNPMLTQKLQILFEKDSSELAEQPKPAAPQTAASAPAKEKAVPTSKPVAAGTEKCLIDGIFENWLSKRLADMQDLIPVIKTVYQWNITKNGKIVSVWTCDFKNKPGAVHKGPPKTGKPDCTLTLDDLIAARIFEGKEDAMKAFMSGKLKISGNILAAQKLQQLWAEEAPRGAISLEEVAVTEKQAPDSVDADIENVPVSGLKGDVLFHIFKLRMHEEPDFMKRLRVIFQFNILKGGKTVCVWTADNKTQPETQIYREPPRGVKPDCAVTLADDDLLGIMTGRINPQRLFMMGKVKVKGNIMLLQKLNSLWLEFQKLGKTPELPLVVDILMKDPLKPGVRSETMVLDLVQRIVKLPDLKKEIPGYYQFDITKDGKTISVWTLDLKANVSTFFRGPAPEAPRTKFTLHDDDFARLVLMKSTLAEGVSKKKIILEGDSKILDKLQILFSTPTTRVPKPKL